MNEIEFEVEIQNDLDKFEHYLQTSPVEDLNTKRKRWKDGNILHGLVHMNDNEITEAPVLMDCEKEHWLYLVYIAKKKGVNICQKNEKGQTPIQYFQSISEDDLLINLTQCIMNGIIQVHLE